MTSEDAKEGVCVYLDEAGADDVSCRGSDCVAHWRWEMFSSNGKPMSKKEPTHGYCSRGGQP